MHKYENEITKNHASTSEEYSINTAVKNCDKITFSEPILLLYPIIRFLLLVLRNY